MIDVSLLGRVSVRADGRPLTGEAGQRRRLALLALLSVPTPRPLSRDRAMLFLWPDSDSASARHLLSVAVHVLRRALGHEALLTTNDEITLVADAVRVDVAAFEEALRRGDHEEALNLYGGPFMDSFNAGAGPELEQWIDAERTRLERSYAQALEGAAAARRASGDLTGAVEAWRKRVMVDPYSSQGALGLMRALAETGDRVAAIRHAEVYRQLLAAEIGAAADPQVEALVQALRNEPPPAAPVPSPSIATLTARASPAAAPASGHAGAPEATSSPPVPPTALHTLGTSDPSQAEGSAPLSVHLRTPLPGRRPDDEPASRRDRTAAAPWLTGVAGVLVGIPLALVAVGVGHALRPNAVLGIRGGVLLGAAGLLLGEAVLLVPWLKRRPSVPLAVRPSGHVGAGLGFALGVVVALSFAYTLAPLGPSPPVRSSRTLPDSAKRRVTVTRFANLTGDPALEPIGRMAEDWVVRRLRTIPEAEVVAVASATTADTSLDAVTTLANRTGADLVLFGTYYRDGDDLLLTARLVPPRAGRIPPEIAGMGIGPVRGPRDRPLGAIDRLASVVAGAVAGACGTPPCVPGRRAPMYEARQLYHEALDAGYRGDVDVARQKYRQAIHLDSTFVNAYTHLAEASDCAQKDSIGGILEARRQDFGVYDLLYMRIIRARCRGDGEAIYRLRREQLDLAPQDQATGEGTAEAALLTGRLREAEALYRAGWVPSAPGKAPTDYANLTYVLHLEGKIGEELRVAAEARHRRPLDPWIPSPQLGLRGLAALARTRDLEARVDEARRGGANLLSVAQMYSTAALELEWHGHAEAARQFALSALRELDRASPAERAEDRYVVMRANMLLELGRWTEARGLSYARNPQNPFRVTVRGLASAGAGDSSAARAALAALERLPDSAFYGPPTREECQASILAALGEKEKALRRLEDGQARNTLPRSGPHVTHPANVADPSGDLLRPLWHDARFERMFAVRD